MASLPYHHPFMFADRMVQLDHLTRGRLIVGVGPGALPGDAYMMGMETTRQRDMMLESLEAVLELWRNRRRTGSRQTDWFTLRDAQIAIAAVQQARHRGERGGDGVTLRAGGGGQLRHRIVVDRGDAAEGVRCAGAELADRHRNRGRVWANGKPGKVADDEDQCTSPILRETSAP